VAALSPALSAAVAVAIVGVYEVGMAVGHWRQSGRVR
jgi:hypothetical protein